MRIIAVTDMHGNLEPVWTLIEEHRPDLLLCCGDWGDPGQVTREQFDQLTAHIHTLSVFGNHDDLDLLQSLTNKDGSPVHLVNAVPVEVMGIRVAGINGIWAKSHRNPWYITDEEILAAGRALKGQEVDILLTHGCAARVCDQVPGLRHGGHRMFLEAVKAAKPKIHLCGHLHLQQTKFYEDGRIAANVGDTSTGDYILIDCYGDDWKLEPRSL